MKAHIARSITFCIGIAFCLPSSASDGHVRRDGNFLLSECTAAIKMLNKESADRSDGWFCLGYITGFEDGHRSVVFENRRSFKNSNTKMMYCTAEDRKISTEQMIRVVVKFLQDRPTILDFPMSFLTWQALSEAFPCK